MNAGGTLTLLGSLQNHAAKVAMFLPGGGQLAGRLTGDVQALMFHLSPRKGPTVVAVLGGTGTGKSTIVNRLVEAGEQELTATSFRRTHTAGAIALTCDLANVPKNLLALPHRLVTPDALPARGGPDEVLIVQTESDLLKEIILIDTPDVDGDTPSHHQVADRVFRWAQAIVFVVSPEKYQMPELLPFYRMSRRYGLPRLFVMNKLDTREQLEDYLAFLTSSSDVGALETSSTNHVPAFAIARDDASVRIDAEQSLAAMRSHVQHITLPATSKGGTGRRLDDLLGRVNDSILLPAVRRREIVDKAIESLSIFQAPATGVDVDPMTRALRKRLQQRSVLYLMGPMRIVDRLMQAPNILARLPRSTFDLFKGKSASNAEPSIDAASQEVPDFRATVIDQFSILQARLDDTITGQLGRSFQVLQGSSQSVSAPSDLPTPTSMSAWRIDKETAGMIVDEELSSLREWLEERWKATPRDTALVMKLLKKLPGGNRLTRASEAAPYLLTIYLALQHLALSGVDLLVIGGFSLATWLGERMSNEVNARTKLANRNIDDRFAALVALQTEKAREWLETQSPTQELIDQLELDVDELANTKS